MIERDSTHPFINISAVQHQPVVTAPFPHLVIPNFINLAFLPALITTFPVINKRGSIPVTSINLSSIFQQFVAELQGDALRQIIAEKFAINLEDKPPMLTLRGYTTTRDGYIHTDSKDKLITILLYMNPSWSTTDGNLRLLNSKKSLEDYFLEVPAQAGTCLIFAVTPNCWHGHKPFIGKRLSMQLNYLTSQKALRKHYNLHKFTAFIKKKLNLTAKEIM
jgi:SM-20-related protein